MIDLNDDNDPMLFRATCAAGVLVFQYMEVVFTLQGGGNIDANPDSQKIIAAMRQASRTPDIAKQAEDAVLMAIWHRMSIAVNNSKND
jgi:hypothetical protein